MKLFTFVFIFSLFLIIFTKNIDNEPSFNSIIVCPDGVSICPLEDAVCCTDRIHCCPVHYKCDLKIFKCDRTFNAKLLRMNASAKKN